jgi:starch-binding outer membrane protein, SusD/RagB family
MNMKKYIIILGIGLFTFFLSSCLKDYLDQAPTATGLSEEDVFSSLENFKLYFDKTYGSITASHNLHEMLNEHAGWDGFTDLLDPCKYNTAHMVKGGSFGEGFLSGFIGICYDAFANIRICNMSLEKIGLLKGTDQNAINDLIAQAHFVRAYSHLRAFRLWGPMPYITTVIGPYDQWDIARLSKHETLIRIAADMDTAATYFAQANLMRRDPGPGGAGHLNSPDQFRPNGVAAKAFKAQALLYAASPLNNELGIKDWEEAAKANWEAIQIAEEYSYALLDSSHYKLNFVGTTYTNEELWGWAAGTQDYGSPLICPMFTAGIGSVGGESPSQNAVDKFETKWGDPLNTEEDRINASDAGHYNEQDPYANRDPRFYIDVIYNQAPLIGYGQADIFYEMQGGTPVYGELLNQDYMGVTQTGYYNRKYWGDQSILNKVEVQISEPLIRLAELYLNYAEATNEAYGPNTPAPGASMTAIQAINVIRSRIGMADVLPELTQSKDVFRQRIKNERAVELICEGHYYDDIRRWMDAPVTMSGPVYKVDIEKVPVSSNYPTGFKYSRNVPIPANHQTGWKNAMYYFPFPMEDTYKMKNFVTNESW